MKNDRTSDLYRERLPRSRTLLEQATELELEPPTSLERMFRDTLAHDQARHDMLVGAAVVALQVADNGPSM